MTVFTTLEILCHLILGLFLLCFCSPVTAAFRTEEESVSCSVRSSGSSSESQHSSE